MVTVYDIPGDKMVNEVAERLKDVEDIDPPEWSDFVKTGDHKELPPEDDDWWYTRTASVFRRVYIDGPIGVSRLSKRYGGRKRRGSQPARSKRGSKNIIRTVLQELEDAGLVETVEGQGRRVTSEGQSYLDEIAEEISEDLPELQKY